MKIIVCLGVVRDTTTKVKFSGDNEKFDASGVQWVINPWDELALTRAMQLKEDSGNVVDKVIVITVGSITTEPVIRKALAIGADEAVRIDMDPKDSYELAFQLSEFLKKEQEQHIVFAGIESSDYNGAAVGGMLAELLGVNSVSAVSGLEIEGEKPKIFRDIDGGTETLEMDIPFVAIVQKGIAKEPRIPAMRGIMMARKKPLNVFPPAGSEAFTEIIGFELPEPKPPCKMIDADHAEELINLLHNEAKIL